ncbi:hypothetical protein D3C81_2284830 [compost metagenome]
MLLTYIQQGWNIAFLDHMTFLEQPSFEFPRKDLRQIMRQHHPDRFLNLHLAKHILRLHTHDLLRVRSRCPEHAEVDP